MGGSVPVIKSCGLICGGGGGAGWPSGGGGGGGGGERGAGGGGGASFIDLGAGSDPCYDNGLSQGNGMAVFTFFA
jgi:hypothetical protein